MAGKLGSLLLVLFIAGCAQVPLHSPAVSIDQALNDGAIGPIHHNNARQKPFSCQTLAAGLGAPLADNREEKGIRISVYDSHSTFSQNYSADCLARNETRYFYLNQQGHYIALRSGDSLPSDAVLLSAKTPLVVRQHVGVLNRFIYSVSMASQWPPQDDETSLWNKRLIMFFDGGIGLGSSQASDQSLANIIPSTKPPLSMHPELLQQGYAIATSTGMATSTTYNLKLLSQTSAMLKQWFELRYGPPKTTIGLGGSGGAIQQLYLAQNHPKLLNGLIISHSFPDLLSQINPVGDCELLQYYFDRFPQYGWNNWQQRRWVEGFNSQNTRASKLADPSSGAPLMSSAERGGSVCSDGWRRVVTIPMLFNPNYFNPLADGHLAPALADSSDYRERKWTLWDDASEIFGTDAQGYARRSFDNSGVQYGLNALREKQISSSQFIHLNQHIGGWVESSQMKQAPAPYMPYGILQVLDGKLSLWQLIRVNTSLGTLRELSQQLRNTSSLLPIKLPEWIKKDDNLSVWSHYNNTAHRYPLPAPRSVAPAAVIDAIKQHGMQFSGDVEHPIIALSIYKDHKLDIHDARQPFVIRERIRQQRGNSNNMAIWGVGSKVEDSDSALRLVGEAVTTMDQWLSDAQRPAKSHDRCLNTDTSELVAGAGIWRGITTPVKTDDGICSWRFPLHGNPRLAAGEPFSSKTIKCRTKPLEQALVDGTYGQVKFSAAEIEKLKELFADSGVCDF